jgi:hypothetical protein
MKNGFTILIIIVALGGGFGCSDDQTESKVKQLEQMLTAEREKVKTLQKELNGKTLEADILQDDLKAKEQEAKTLISEQKSEKGHADTLSRDLDAEKGRTQNLRRELDTARNRAETLRREREAKERESKTLRQELDGERAKIEQLNREIERLKKELEAKIMLKKPYTVVWFNDYSGLAALGSTAGIGKAIDREIFDQFKRYAEGMIQMVQSDSFSVGTSLGTITAASLESINAEVAFIGAIGRDNNGFTIKLRLYSKKGNYLSGIVSTTFKDRAEIAREYHGLAIRNFPFCGIVTDASGNRLTITLQAGAYISKDKNLIADRRWQAVGHTGDFKFARLSFDGRRQLSAEASAGGSRIRADTTIVSVAEPSTQSVDKLTVRLLDRDGNRLKNFQVSVMKAGAEEYVGTLTYGEIDLSRHIQGEQTLHVTLKTQNKQIVHQFDIEFSEVTNPYIKTLPIRNSDFK